MRDWLTPIMEAEVLPSAVCKVELQESWCSGSGQNSVLRISGASGVTPFLSLKAGEVGVLISTGRRRQMCSSSGKLLCPSSAFLFYSEPQRIRGSPVVLVRGIFFTQSTNSMLISSRNTLTDTLRNKVLPAIWASLRLNHCIDYTRVILVMNFPHEIQYLKLKTIPQTGFDQCCLRVYFCQCSIKLHQHPSQLQ